MSPAQTELKPTRGHFSRGYWGSFQMHLEKSPHVFLRHQELAGPLPWIQTVVWSLLLNFPDHPSFHLLWCKGTMASCSSDLKSLTCKHLCGGRTPSLSSSRTLTETLSPSPTNSLKALSQLLQSHFPQMLYVICSIFQWINVNFIHPLWEREPALKDPLIMNIYKGLAPGLRM